MENEDNSPNMQRVAKIEDSPFTTGTQVNPQEVPQKRLERPEKQLPSLPFLYQG
jgi:hypothetical protein